MRRGQEASSAVVNEQQPCGPKKKRLTMVREKKEARSKKIRSRNGGKEVQKRSEENSATANKIVGWGAKRG